MRAFVPVVAAFFVTHLAGPAAADSPPPPGYIERCSVENHERDGRRCLTCPADYSRRHHCEEELGPGGYTRACQTHGASAWTEVWCSPVRPVPDQAPSEDASADAPEVRAADVAPRRGKCGAGGLETGVPLALALGTLIVARRRR